MFAPRTLYPPSASAISTKSVWSIWRMQKGVDIRVALSRLHARRSEGFSREPRPCAEQRLEEETREHLRYMCKDFLETKRPRNSAQRSSNGIPITVLRWTIWFPRYRSRRSAPLPLSWHASSIPPICILAPALAVKEDLQQVMRRPGKLQRVSLDGRNADGKL